MVVVEDETMVLLGKGSKQVEDVLSVILALSLTMRECEDCCSCCLVPGDQPVPGSLDRFGCHCLLSQDSEISDLMGDFRILLC